MSDNEKKVLKVKTAVKQTADKIKNSESTEKALHTVNDLADKTKSSYRDFNEKIKSNETLVKIANSDMSEKTKELIDSVKSKNVKANKIIKVVAISLIAIIVLSIIFSSFGSNNKKVFESIENYTAEQASIGYFTSDYKIKSMNIIGTVKTDVEHAGVVKRYVIEISSIVDGEEQNGFIIVGEYKDGGFTNGLIPLSNSQYGYGNNNDENRTREQAYKSVIDTATYGNYKFKKN